MHPRKVQAIHTSTVEYKTWEWSQLRTSGKSRSRVSRKVMLFRDEGVRKSTEGRTGKVWGTVFSKCGYPGHGFPPSGLWFPVLTSVRLSSSPLNSWVPFQIPDFSITPRSGTAVLYAWIILTQLLSNKLLLSTKFNKHSQWNHPFSPGQRQSVSPSLLSLILCKPPLQCKSLTALISQLFVSRTPNLTG